MSDERVLEKVNGSEFRYRFGSHQFSACGDEHAHRMKDAVLENEAKQGKPFQEDPLTPQMRLKLGPVEAERQARALCPVYKAKAEAAEKAVRRRKRPAKKKVAVKKPETKAPAKKKPAKKQATKKKARKI